MSDYGDKHFMEMEDSEDDIPVRYSEPLPTEETRYHRNPIGFASSRSIDTKKQPTRQSRSGSRRMSWPSSPDAGDDLAILCDAAIQMEKIEGEGKSESSMHGIKHAVSDSAMLQRLAYDDDNEMNEPEHLANTFPRSQLRSAAARPMPLHMQNSEGSLGINHQFKARNIRESASIPPPRTRSSIDNNNRLAIYSQVQHSRTPDPSPHRRGLQQQQMLLHRTPEPSPRRRFPQMHMQSSLIHTDNSNMSNSSNNSKNNQSHPISSSRFVNSERSQSYKPPRQDKASVPNHRISRSDHILDSKIKLNRGPNLVPSEPRFSSYGGPSERLSYPGRIQDHIPPPDLQRSRNGPSAYNFSSQMPPNLRNVPQNQRGGMPPSHPPLRQAAAPVNHNTMRRIAGQGYQNFPGQGSRWSQTEWTQRMKELEERRRRILKEEQNAASEVFSKMTHRFNTLYLNRSKDGSSDVQIKDQMESIKELLKTVNLWESAKKKLAPGALQFFQSRV